METFCYKKMKIYEYDAGHMTKMAPTLIYAKNASIIFFSGTLAYHSLFKWWPLVDLDLFYHTTKFCNLGFSEGKSENSGFFQKLFQHVICKLEDNWLS